MRILDCGIVLSTETPAGAWVWVTSGTSTVRHGSRLDISGWPALALGVPAGLGALKP